MFAACVLPSRAGWAAASSEPIWLVMSSPTGIHAEAAAAFQADWKAGRPDREVVVCQAQDLPNGAPPGGIVTLGLVALRAVLERIDNQAGWAHVPVVAALIPKEGLQATLRHAPPNLTAAYLDQPFERYVELIKLAWPSFNRLGLLVGPEQSQSSPAMFKAAQERGFKLSLGRVSRPESLFGTLRTVLSESDVLLVLPDAALADAADLQTILITAYRQRTPVVAYSPALVKAGAALGLYASPAQAGRQVATLLRATLSGSRVSPRLAEGITVSINEQVCRSLGWSLPDGNTLAEALKR